MSDATGPHLATLAARRYLSLLAEGFVAEAMVVRAELPFASWPEPWRTDSLAQFLYEIGEPEEAFAEARACAANCGWDDWSRLLLVWTQVACYRDRDALETLDERSIGSDHLKWADHLRFRLHLRARQFECASAYLKDRGIGLTSDELVQRRHLWLATVDSRDAERFELETCPLPPLSALAVENIEYQGEGSTVQERCVEIALLVGQGDLATAEVAARLLTRIASDFPRGWVLLARLLFETGSYQLSEDAIDEALRLSPQYASARLARANMRYRRGRFRAAAEDASVLIAQQPLNHRITGLLLRSLVRSGQYRRALSVAKHLFPAIRHSLRVYALQEQLEQAERTNA